MCIVVEIQLRKATLTNDCGSIAQRYSKFLQKLEWTRKKRITKEKDIQKEKKRR